METIKISAKLGKIPIVLDTEDGERKGTLQEMTGAQRDEYLNKMTARMKFNDQGKVVGVKEFTGLQASLVSRCLYWANGDMSTMEEAQALPASALDVLYKEAQKMNRLDDDDKEKKIKND